MTQTNAAGVSGTTGTNASPLASAVAITVTCAPLPTDLHLQDSDATVLFASGLAHLALDDAPPRLVVEGDMLLVSPGGTVRHTAGTPGDWLRLTAPRRFLSPALPGRATTIVPRSTTTEALRHYLTDIAAMLVTPPEPTLAQLIATAVRDLLAAATVVSVAPVPRCARRNEEMLERIVTHIDAHLGDDISIATLCHALGYSRSALYRAAAPMGGLVAVMMQRRLAAIYQTLRRTDERRSIAEIARTYGFADASQFSRRFRRAFGVSAGQVRAVGA